jgi:hypothetical protein
MREFRLLARQILVGLRPVSLANEPGPQCRPEPLRRALTLPRKRPASFLLIAGRLFDVGPIVRLSDISEQIGNFRRWIAAG